MQLACDRDRQSSELHSEPNLKFSFGNFKTKGTEILWEMSGRRSKEFFLVPTQDCRGIQSGPKSQ